MDIFIELDLKLYKNKLITKNILYLNIKKQSMVYYKAYCYFAKYKKDLENIGFTINPYDPYITNKVINKQQIIIVWYINDLKI